MKERQAPSFPEAKSSGIDDKIDKKAENKYPKTLEELTMEIYSLLKEAEFFTEESHKTDKNLKKEIKDSLINTAKEVIYLFKHPEEKTYWHGVPNNWKEVLDILRAIPGEMTSRFKYQDEESAKEFTELMSLGKDVKERIFNKKIDDIKNKIKETSLPHINLLIKNIEIEFQKAFLNNDPKEEERAWRTINELGTMDLKKLEEMNNLFKEVEQALSEK